MPNCNINLKKTFIYILIFKENKKRVLPHGTNKISASAKIQACTNHLKFFSHVSNS